MKATAPGSPPIQLDPEQLSRVRRAVSRLGRRMRQESGGGVTPSQLSVLVSIDKHQAGPITLGELATAEHISAPAVSRTVRGLEEEGLVLREGVEDDRRVARISLTPRARRLLQSIRGQQNAWLAARIAELTPRQVSDLEKGIAAIERIIADGDVSEAGDR
jgi:DNA-binding MarR family transcriptional regulator